MRTTDDPAQCTQILNNDLEKIGSWARTWKITFNADKSKDILFSRKYINSSPPIVFNNEYITRVNTVKHLGIYLTSNLDWSLQIYNVCLRANRKLSVLRQVRNLQRSTLDLLYKITIRSVLDYSLFVYFHNLNQLDIAKLNKIQYRAAKLVTGTLYY